jgi:hypothetical protein
MTDNKVSETCLHAAVFHKTILILAMETAELTVFEEYRNQDFLILSDCGEFFNERLLNPRGFLFFPFYDFRDLISLSH